MHGSGHLSDGPTRDIHLVILKPQQKEHLRDRRGWPFWMAASKVIIKNQIQASGKANGNLCSKVSLSCEIILKPMPKCRYRCGVCAGEALRVRSVPVTGTAEEGDTLVGRGGEPGLILESPAPLHR